METKIKINSCVYDSGKSYIEVQVSNAPEGCLVAFEGSDPSPAFIKMKDGTRIPAVGIPCSQNETFNIELSSINGGESVPVFATFSYGDETVMAADVFIKTSENNESSIVSVSPSFVGIDDSITFYFNGKVGERVDFYISDKKFAADVGRNGVATMTVPASVIFAPRTFNGRSITKFKLKAESPSSGSGEAAINVIPKNMFALAAVEDVNRPSCVIMDPGSSASFSLAADTYPRRCFSEPLISHALDSRGEQSSALESYSENWKNCDNAYASVMSSVIDADCRIQENWSVVNLKDKLINLVDDVDGVTSVNGDWAAVWAACDPDPTSGATAFDPCNISDNVLSKIPRIFAAVGQSAVALDVIKTGRISIKKSSSYYHSAFLSNPSVGKVASIIVRMEDGNQISKTVSASEDYLATLSALRTELLNDPAIVSYGISIAIAGSGSSTRLDFGADARFTIKSGSTSALTAENSLRVTLNSNYVIQGELTYPIDVMSGISDATHILILDGPFSGLIFPFSIDGSSVSIDACPRINTLGSFRVDQDYTCMHVALIRSLSKTFIDTNIIKLPFLTGEGGNVIPASSPSISEDGSIVCSGVDGLGTYIYYHNGINQSEPWTRLSNKSYDYPKIVSDIARYEDCVICENSFKEETQLHACYIGAASTPRVHSHLSSFWNHISSSEEWSRYVTAINADSYNPIDTVSGASLISRDSIVNLSKGVFASQGAIVVYESLVPAIASSSDIFFDSSYEDGANPYANTVSPSPFALGSSLASILIQIDASSTSTYNISANLKGRIVKILASGPDLDRTDEYFGIGQVLGYDSSNTGIYPVPGNPRVSSFTLSLGSDLRSFSLSLSATGTGICRLRILVEPDISELNSPTTWNRIGSGDSLISVSSASNVVMEMTPDGSECAAVASLYTDENGNYFDGNFDQINYGIDTYINISDITSFQSESNLIASSSSITELEPAALITAISGNGDTTVNTWRYAVEYIGPAYSARPSFYPLDYRRTNLTPVFSATSPVLNGVREGELCSVILFDIKATTAIPNGGSVTGTISFNSPITYVDVKRNTTNAQNPLLASDIEYASSNPASLVTARNQQAPIVVTNGSISFSISQDRKTITFSVARPTSTVRHGFRIYISNQNDSILSPKSENDVDKEINKILSKYSKVGNLYVVGSDPQSNRMSASRSGFRYDSCVPLISSCRFDDLNVNPNADVPISIDQTGQLSLESSDSEYGIVPNISSSAAPDFYSQSYPFRMGGNRSNLVSWGLVLLLEKETLILTNSESPSEFAQRNSIASGIPNGYIESKIHEVFTGKAKLAIVCNPRPSKALDGSIGKIESITSSGSPFFVQGGFRVSLTSSMVKMSADCVEYSKKRDKIISDIEDPSYNVPNFSSILLCAVNGVPHVGAHVIHDEPSKRRQIDIAFGNPYGEKPFYPFNVQSPIPFRSGRRYSINFSSIYLGSPFIRFSEQVNINNFDSNLQTIFVPSPSASVYMQNGSFESAFADPGDFIHLEHGNQYIDSITVANGGLSYVGSYLIPSNGSRSVILESNIDSNFEFNISNPDYASLTFIKSRRLRCSSGVGGGLKFDSTLPAQASVLESSVGMRRYSAAEPTRNRTVMMIAGDQASSYRISSRQGEFTNGSKPDFIRNRLLFDASGSQMNFYINNLDTDLHKTFAFSYSNTSGSSPANYSNDYTSVFYYISTDGNLMRSYINTSLSSWGFNPCSRQDRVQISSQVIKVSSKGSAAADASGVGSYVVYLKSDGSLGHYGERVDFVLDSGDFILPVGNNFVDIASGIEFGIALRKNGSIEAWGSDSSIVDNVPSGNFVSIDCGAHFACALKEDGSVVCWGDNSVNQCDSPSGVFVKIRCGWDSSVALDAEGSATMWGKTPVSGPWSVPEGNFRDIHIGGGPFARIYPSDVNTATGAGGIVAGGTDASNTHDPAVIHSGEISRYAIGITTDGDILTWGDDSVVSVNDTDDPNSLDNTLLYQEFTAVPDVKAISVFCGPQGACIISDNGYLIGFGSGQTPYYAEGSTSYISYYASEKCVHKGGVIVDSVSLAPEYMLFDESENPPRWAQMGYASEYEWQLTRGTSSLNGASIIPITIYGEGVNRNASVFSRDGRVHIAFESTRDKQNCICYTSSYPSVRRFDKALRITNGAIDRNRPSIAVDQSERKLIAWRERVGDKEKVSCATSISYADPDPDICFVDSCVLALRRHQSTDPYHLLSVQECEISESFNFERTATNVYFNVELYSDQRMQERVAFYSSLETPDNFMVSGEYMTSEGVSVLPLQSYDFVFLAPNDPSILGGPLWYKVSAKSFSNDFGSVDPQSDYLILKSTGTIVDGTSNDFAAGFDESAGEIYVVWEGVQTYDFNIESKTKAQFDESANIHSRDTGLFLPSNYLTLPGVPSQLRTMSYLIHIKNDSTAYNNGTQYSGKITFSSPVAAIIFNGDELEATTGIAAGNAVYPSAADRGTVFASGTKLVLSPDGRTVHMNFVAKDPAGRSSGFAVQQLRILTIESNALESEQYGVFGCDKIRHSPCGIQFKYTNLIGSTASAFSRVHFRATVYSSSDVDDVVAIFSSVTHPQMWSNGSELFPSQGLPMYKNDSLGIGFYPNMVSASSAMSSFDESDTVLRTLSNNNPYYDIIRESLFFDISYRIRIDAIVTLDPTGDPSVQQVPNISEQFMFCSETSNWKDAENDIGDWRSSGSGLSDTVISESSVCGYPYVDSGRKTFYIGFEKYADIGSSGQLPSCPDICLAVWDAEEDRFDSSGQGGKDRIINIGHSEIGNQVNKYRYPHVIVDDLSNFSVFGLEQRDDGSSIGKSDGSVGYQKKPEIVSNIEDLRPCSFSDSLGERFAEGEDPPSYMKIRVYENDIVSFAPSGSILPRPVVSSSLINLDIIGAPGTYAIRIKNDDTADFSPWIPIGGDVPVLPLDAIDPQDYRNFQDIFRARYISRDRFTMPWMLSSGSGLKTICAEVLTFFGKTPSFCTEVICEPSMPEYSMKIYAQVGDVRIPLSRYKGYPVISPFAFASDKPQISEEDLRSIEESERLKVESIYVEIEFSNYSLIEKIVNLGNLKFFKNRLSGRSSVNASVIYRGTQQIDIDLSQDSEKKNVFHGSFNLKRSDGILRQDGIGLISVDIPILGIQYEGINFIRQNQEFRGRSINESFAQIPLSNSIKMPPIDEDAVSRAFGNSEYYS